MSEPLANRFGLAFQDFLGTAIVGDPVAEAARVIVAAMTFRKRDEDTVITPESDMTKGPRLIVAVTDNGRVKSYTPIRILRATVAVRGLAVLPGSTKAAPGALTATAFNALCGAVETVLDCAALRAQNGTVPGVTSETRGIATLLCTRQPGTTPTRLEESGIRTDTYALDIRAVKMEHTVPPAFDDTGHTFDSSVRTFDSANGNPPIGITLSNLTVAEPGASAVTVGDLAPIGGAAPVAFEVTSSGGHQLFFAIDSAGWKLRVRDPGGLNYTGPVSVTVRATDANGATFDRAFTITIT